jgi:O-6-methylguanine DNA methyltransferase
VSLLAYCIFETPLGSCGIAWREGSDSAAPPPVVFFQFPESTRQATEARIAKATGATRPSAPPEAITQLIGRVRKYLHGEPQDFRDVQVDLSAVSPFVRTICEAAREIPAGQTVTYAALATVLGGPSLARAVGRALGSNPIPLIIPCHRVVAAHGKRGGFSAFGGSATKARLLALEGAEVNLCLNLTEDAPASG